MKRVRYVLRRAGIAACFALGFLVATLGVVAHFFGLPAALAQALAPSCLFGFVLGVLFSIGMGGAVPAGLRAEAMALLAGACLSSLAWLLGHWTATDAPLGIAVLAVVFAIYWFGSAWYLGRLTARLFPPAVTLYELGWTDELDEQKANRLRSGGHSND
jgi:hypothetical protein